MPNERLQTAAQRRGVIKAALTRFKRYLETCEQPLRIEELTQRTEKAKETWDSFEAIQSEIEAISEDVDQDKEREAFEDMYFSILSKAQRLLEHAKSTQSEANAATEAVGRLATRNETANIRLPRINLPIFCGKYDEWLCFYDSFKSVIHDNTTINLIDKFQYLRSSLKGEAAQIIQSFETSEQNYILAWNLLNDRYNNRRVIAQTHIRALFDLQIVVKESHMQLHHLIDNVSKHVRALKALGQPTDSWDAMLIHLVTSKLDRETHKQWENSISGTEMPAFEELTKFLRNKCHVLENIAQETASNTRSTVRPYNLRNAIPSGGKAQAYVATEGKTRCPLCNRDHTLTKCLEFQTLDVNAKRFKVKALRLCYNCLRPHHTANECNSGSCRKCDGRHHTLLHLPNMERTAVLDPSENPDNSKNVTASVQTVSSQVLLSTAMINIRSNSGKFIPCKALLDSGSQSNFVSERLSLTLQLPRKTIDVPVSGFSQALTHIKNRVTTTIESRDKRYTAELDFLVAPKITERLPLQYVNKTNLDIPRNLLLADPEFCKPSEIDVLIGVEIFYQLLCVGQIKVGNQSAVLQKTKLGWVVSGRIRASTSHEQRHTTTCNLAINSLNDLVARFWEMEDLFSFKHLSREEAACEEHFSQNTIRDDTGRYHVALPFNARKEELGESYQTTLRRFYALERKLFRDDQLRKNYVAFLEEYATLGHMSEVECDEDKRSGCFIPHHAVIKSSSQTTKLRVVFDASAPTSTGVSLNDTLMVGPLIQEDVFSIIMRFRLHVHVLAADVEKMYRQVGVRDEDTKYQQILWRSRPDDPVKTFQLNTITYGTASASFLATRCLLQLANDEGESFPMAAKALREDFYVDDLLTGASNIPDALQLRNELIQLLSKGGFRLRKWCSNREELLESLSETSEDTHLFLDIGESQKTLGLYWNPRCDEFEYVINIQEENKRVTKRNMLSQIASLFDPLGLLGPVIVKAKVLLQQLWKVKLEWDESVPTEVATAWCKYRTQLLMLNAVKIPRRIVIEQYEGIQVHGFSDSSEAAFGACVYLRSINRHQQVLVRLVCSKSRVAPIKKISLPRLELSAAVLLAKLYDTCVRALRLTSHKTFLWSDSTICLHWIKTPPHKLKTFVANRVALIQTLTSQEHWRYVSSQENPADQLSRGQFPQNFLENCTWIGGPPWLLQGEETWPRNLVPVTTIPEQREVIVLKSHEDIGMLERFSSFTTMKRAIAYCFRFVLNAGKKERSLGELTVNEIRNASDCIIRMVQRGVFADEYRRLSLRRELKHDSRLLSLNPFLDVNNIIRVGGRLRHSDIDYEQKHPILLPKNNHVSELIIREAHIGNYHCGVQTTLNFVRCKFWPIDGKSYVKRVLRECVRCARLKPHVPSHIMGDLPKDRLIGSRPFECVGVDYCGPFYIKEKRHRNRGKVKVYVCIFVCFLTKAIHIELAADLTTAAFIASLRRFFARRGKAKTIYSDNATNFKGARNELQVLYRLLHSDQHIAQVNRFCADQEIVWKFIPPRSPHFGGLWEAAVKGFKYHMRRVVGDSLFAYEELNTFLIEIESILNSRPLTQLSADPNDLLPLTPSHFLIGCATSSLAEYDITQLPVHHLSVWQHVQKIKETFWKRWRNEYINELQQRTRWSTGNNNGIKVGTMVLLKDDATPPLQWLLGRVTALHPGDDGIVRVVTVKTSSGSYKRAIRKLAQLPID